MTTKLTEVPVLVLCVHAAVSLRRLIERRAEDVRPSADIWGRVNEASVETLTTLSDTTYICLSELQSYWARQAEIIEDHFQDRRGDTLALQGERISRFLIKQYYPFMGMMKVLGLGVDLHPDGLNEAQKRAMAETRRTWRFAWSEILQLEIVLPDEREFERLGIHIGITCQEKAEDLAAHLSIQHCASRWKGTWRVL